MFKISKGLLKRGKRVVYAVWSLQVNVFYRPAA